MPFFSVIIPAYNRATLIKLTVDHLPSDQAGVAALGALDWIAGFLERGPRKTVFGSVLRGAVGGVGAGLVGPSETACKGALGIAGA